MVAHDTPADDVASESPLTEPDTANVNGDGTGLPYTFDCAFAVTDNDAAVTDWRTIEQKHRSRVAGRHQFPGTFGRTRSRAAGRGAVILTNFIVL